MDWKYINGTMFYYYKDLDKNLGWLTQKTEEPKSKTLLFLHTHTHTVNVIELLSNKKVATPHFYFNPPLSFSPLSSRKSGHPPRDSIRRGGGVPAMYLPTNYLLLLTEYW